MTAHAIRRPAAHPRPLGHRANERFNQLALVTATLVSLLGCSSPQPPGTGPVKPPAASAATPQAAASAASRPTPSSAAPGSKPAAAQSNQNSAVYAGLTAFDQVVKGAEVQRGLMPVWRKGDKVWLELTPEMLGKPLFLSPKLATGIGEAGVFGGLMQSRFAQVGRPQWVEFRRVNQQIQLLAINSSFVADAQTPQALSVKTGYSPSLLAGVPLASAPHPGTGSVLIEAAPLLLGDWLGMAQHLQRTYRQSYALDGRNSTVQVARTEPHAAVFEVVQHFATGGIAAPGVPAPGTPPSTVPLNQPDPRSLFLTLHLSFTPLPEHPMARRLADPRVGYFTSTVTDFTQDLPRTPRIRFINRWRLDKKHPEAPMSEPVQPIVFWLDPNIPEAYRDTIQAGVLEWNKAFEAIGLKQAIEVRTPPTDQPFDTLQTGHASIRWMTNSQPQFGAIGPSHVDPRSGEILDAHIALESLSSRAIRTARSQILTTAVSDRVVEDDRLASTDRCHHAEVAYEQLDWGLQWLQAHPGLDPDAPDVNTFVLAYLKDTTMHEVGHALGLRHNFRASHWRSPQQLLDRALTTTEGNSASVMDYGAINLPPPGQTGGAPFQTTLGPYDYWAIAYGYTPLPEEPAEAQAALKHIVDRAGHPDEADALAFGTDEDNALGLDPEVVTFDLGRDPVAFARTRVAIVQDMLSRLAQRPPGPVADPSLARRTVLYGLREMSRAGQVLLRQVGGVVTRRAAAYDGTDALQPLPGPQQRAALDMVLQHLLRPDALALPPALQRRLAPDYTERADNGEGQFGGVDFSWADQLLAMQRPVLDYLSSEGLADRLQDNADKVRDREALPLTAQELQQRLFDVVWLAAPAQEPMASAWRSLQREQVNRLAASVVRPASGRADVRAVTRQAALKVLAHLNKHPGAEGSVAEAHSQDCIQSLQTALQASVLRAAP